MTGAEYPILDLTTLLGLATSVQCFLLAAYVLVKGRNLALRLLGALLLVTATVFLHDVLAYSGWILQWPHFVGLGPMHFYLIGPLLYLYFVFRLTPQRRWRFVDALHFLPFAVHLISRLPKLGQSADVKLAMVQAYYENTGGSVPSPEAWSWLLAFAMEDGHRLVYAVLAVLLLKQAGDIDRAAPDPWNLWSNRLLLAFIVCLPASSLLVLEPDWRGYSLLLRVTLLTGFMLLLMVYVFRYSLDSLAQPPQAKKTVMESSLAKSIVTEIRKLLESQALYTDPELRQATISSQLGLSKQELSLAINQETGGSFNDLINSYRIAKAKQLLMDPSLAIQAVCESSGFHSRATFNRVFKEHTGQTPSQLRNSLEPDS